MLPFMMGFVWQKTSDYCMVVSGGGKLPLAYAVNRRSLLEEIAFSLSTHVKMQLLQGEFTPIMAVFDEFTGRNPISKHYTSSC